jgi:thiamine-phosphate pyrophosphorylase
MKTIIYTPPAEVENEIEIISQLLDAGADYLYIRKPELDDFSLVDYVEKIPEKYWKQCISASLIITKEFDLGGYHFTRDIVQRNALYNDKVLDWLHDNNKISSVSAHSTEELRNYAGKFKHVIVSPLFSSISKEGHHYDWDFDDLSIMIADLRFKSEFYAVGGIDLSKLDTVKKLNFDGVGLLGVLWNKSEDAMPAKLSLLNQIKTTHSNDQ